MMTTRKIWRALPSQRVSGISRRFQTTTTTNTEQATTASSTSTSTAMSRAKERAAEKAAADAKRDEMMDYARQQMGRYKMQRPSDEAVMARKQKSRAQLNQHLRVQLMVGAVLVGFIALTPGVGRHFAGTAQPPARLQYGASSSLVEEGDNDDDETKNPSSTGDATTNSTTSSETGMARNGGGLTFGQVLLKAQHDLHEKAKRGELSSEKLEEMRSYLPDSFDDYMPESKQRTMSNDVYTKWRPRHEGEQQKANKEKP